MQQHELVLHHCPDLAAPLEGGGRFLFGDAPCIADFPVAHGAWFLRGAGPQVAAPLRAQPALEAWLDRLLAIGHGSGEPMTGADAVALAACAAAAQGHAPADVDAGCGFAAGAAVTVTPIDDGRDPVAGALVGLAADEVVIARDDPRAGHVHVHFPRHGFRIEPQEHAAAP